MDLRQMRYFAAVAECLSFSRAAARLNVSQSALSRQVRLLEDEMGVRVFDRVGRTIALTPAGADLLARCQSVLKDVESLSHRAAELAGGSAGPLRVGATPQTLESVVSRFLPHYQQTHPQVDVVLVEDGSARLSRELERGRLDLVIGGRPADSVLAGRELFPLGALAVVPPGSRRSGQIWLEIAELAGENLLLLRPHFMTRQVFDAACHAAQIAPRVMIESASPHCLLAFVANGLGTAIIPSTMLLDKMQASAIPLVREGRQIGFAMSVLWDPRRYMPPAAAAFIEGLYAATRDDYPGKAFSFGPMPAAIAGTG